jgi:hypothetical protein
LCGNCSGSGIPRPNIHGMPVRGEAAGIERLALPQQQA